MTFLINNVFNTRLDRLVRPEIILVNKPWPAFQVCGGIGLVLAISLAMGLVIYQSFSSWVMAGIVLVAVSILLGLTMLTKIITGEERIINYHHQIVVLVVTAVLLWLLDQPVWPYLDATMLGVGLFIACGRVGCLMMGCCHGRPHAWGVCYRTEHAGVGFTPHLAGVRLFPIQAVESLWVFGIVLAGSIFVLRGQPPGEAVTWYVVSYALGRFFYEFMRGDAERSHPWGLSEAQWTSILLTAVIAGAGLAGAIPFHGWSFGVATFLLATTLAMILKRHFQRTPDYQLLHPGHIKEVADAISLVADLTTERQVTSEHNEVLADIQISCTSLGVQISVSTLKSEASSIHHYALSHHNEMMTEKTARILARLILQLKHPAGSSEMIRGNQGVYHLMVRS